MYQNIVNKIVRDVCQINGWTKIEMLSVFLFTEFIISLLVFCVFWFNLLSSDLPIDNHFIISLLVFCVLWFNLRQPLYWTGSNCVEFDFVRVCSLVDRYFYHVYIEKSKSVVIFLCLKDDNVCPFKHIIVSECRIPYKHTAVSFQCECSYLHQTEQMGVLTVLFKRKCLSKWERSSEALCKTYRVDDCIYMLQTNPKVYLFMKIHYSFCYSVSTMLTIYACTGKQWALSLEVTCNFRLYLKIG